MRDINCFFLSQVAMGSDNLVYRMPNTKVHGLMDFKMVTDQRHMLILVSLFFAIHKTRYQKISSIKKYKLNRQHFLIENHLILILPKLRRYNLFICIFLVKNMKVFLSNLINKLEKIPCA